MIGQEWAATATRPYGLVNVNVVRSPRVSPSAKGLYVLLTTYADDDRELHIPLTRLADCMGRSIDTLRRYLDELIRLEVAETTTRWIDGSGQYAQGVVLHDAVELPVTW